MLTSLASQAAIALTNKLLIEGLENLLRQFIKSIAKAIDRKSEYTGGHITRVASLTEMIAAAIQKDKKEFPNVKFSENEMQEISIAGWMHDIGKITTPIYIMDKATKLETIFNRIELVKARFEIVKLVIKCDLPKIKNERKKDKLLEILTRLDNDLEFLEHANIGGEFMKDEDLDKIEEISDFQYESDDHIYKLITDNEKENLMIRKGTLLDIEIDKMREHALVSHEMLSKLTFPKKFTNVPKYACGHHEKLNGMGYPFGIHEDELPLQARVIAIADLFEALTAVDRPYKKGKNMTQTLRIMALMAKDQEIDSNLLNLFIDSGLYLEYGKKFLKTYQLDDVDINAINEIHNKN